MHWQAGSPLAAADPVTVTRQPPSLPRMPLLPAARVKLTFDSAVGLAKELNAPDRPDRRELLEQLETMLLLPQNYTRGRQVDVPQKPAQSYLNAYSEYRSKVSILERPGALIVQVSSLLS